MLRLASEPLVSVPPRVALSAPSGNGSLPDVCLQGDSAGSPGCTGTACTHSTRQCPSRGQPGHGEHVQSRAMGGGLGHRGLPGCTTDPAASAMKDGRATARPTETGGNLTSSLLARAENAASLPMLDRRLNGRP